MNMANLLLRAGRSHGSKGAIASGPAVIWTYAELAKRASSLGRSMIERFGLARGDRVIILMRNCEQFIECVFGCWFAGLLPVPVNARLHPREVGYICGNTGSRFGLATPDCANALNQAVSYASERIEIVEVGSQYYGSLLRGDFQSPAILDPTEPAWLFYTSGTTGRPKGATLTHRNLLAMSVNYFADVDSIGWNDSILHAAPMSHGSGMYMLPHIMASALQIIPESGHFDPNEVFSLIERHHGVAFFAAPTMVHRLVEAARSQGPRTDNLKTIIYGGGPMYVADSLRALQVFGPKLAQIYGQGESPMTISVLPKLAHVDADQSPLEERLATVGYSQSVVEVRIGDENDDEVPAGERGEVLVRGDTVMSGYWRDTEATEQAMRSGWLHTGDIGSLDQDGFLKLTDRVKDLIITGGNNVYPREVEEVLLTHGGVAEVAVVGLPDPEWGEKVVAFVVARDEQRPSCADLDRICIDSIARFKRPKQYCFVTQLPKNSYGKVLKTELRKSAGRSDEIQTVQQQGTSQ